MKKLIVKVIGVVVVLGIIGLVVLYFSLGGIVKKGVETVGPTVTKVEVKLDGASVSPFSGSGKLKGFVLGNPEGFQSKSAITVGEMSMGVKPGSLFSDKVIISHVRIVGPEVTFEGGLRGNNLSKILDNVNGFASGSGGTSSGSTGANRKLQVDELVITGTRVHVSVAGKTITVPLPDIKLANLGTSAEGITAAELIQKVLSDVTMETTKAAATAVANVGKDALDMGKNAGEAGVEGVKKTTEGLKNLNPFKKK